MSTETPNPQPGDKARWTCVVEGIVEEVWSSTLHVRDSSGKVRVLRTGEEYGATVEVLERADDPKVGELRRENRDDDSGHSIWQVQENYDGERFWCCVYSTAPGNRDVHFPLEKMLDLPVVGYVPGSPAAYAAATRPQVRVPNEPHGLGDKLRREVAALAAKGHRDDAVDLLVQHTLLNMGGALAYVEGMEEYQTYLSEHGRTEVDPAEADGMRAMGFDKQPEFQVSDEDRALIQSVLDERTTEYVYGQDDGSWKLDGAALAGVVADIVWAAIKRDRERGGR